MFGPVPLQPRTLAAYAPFAGERACQEIAEQAKTLRGARVLHLSALSQGTYVAELLAALVPLMNAVGVAAEWQVVPVPAECTSAHRALYHALAHGEGWSRAAHASWLRYVDAAAALFDRDYDFVVVHDPQPMPLLTAKAARDGRRPAGGWIWHCHLDLHEARPEAWGALRPHLLGYDAAIYAAHEYVRTDTGIRHVLVVPPVIDPLGPRNVDLPAGQVEQTLRRYAIDPRRPLVCQVSPLSPRADPIGLIEAYQLVKPQVPALQLVLLSQRASDDATGRAFADLVGERCRQDEDVRLVVRFEGTGDTEVNAFERAATVVAQRSVGKGFALALVEAMWKGRPVVAGRAGNLPLQLVGGRTGYLAGSGEEFGLRLLDLIQDSEARARLGRAGRERVRRTALVTRCLREYLELFRRLV